MAKRTSHKKRKTTKAQKPVGIDTLRSDIDKLAGDLREMFHHVGAKGKDKLLENKKQLDSLIKTLKDQAEEKRDKARDYLRKKNRKITDKGIKQIEEKPLTAVSAALATGLVLGMLLRRNDM